MACALLPLVADDREESSKTLCPLNALIKILMKHKVDHFSATLGVIQDYGNAGSHNAPQPKQPNQKQVASNPYDFCLVICHRLIQAFILLVNEIAPKVAHHQGLLLPDLSKFPVGKRIHSVYKKVIGDQLTKVSNKFSGIIIIN